MLENNEVFYSYDEAFLASVKYFDGDELAAKVFVDKYSLKDREGKILEDTPEKMHCRLAKEFARIEKGKFKKPISEEEIYGYLKDFKYIIPGGSGLSGIGDRYRYTSLSNCFVGQSPLDSYSSICKADEEIVSVSKRRGGIGFDISNLRPCGSPTSNASKTSTGIVPFCERYSNTIREVGQAGRRGALILTISVHHPEIINFIVMKQDLQKVNGANISVRLTDEFLNAVDKNEKYEQRWPVDSENPVISNMVESQEVWNQIIKSAHQSAEPGILLWDNIIKESPADCYPQFKSVSTNPCAELPLSERDSCRLLLLNSYSFVDDPFTKESKFNFDKFYNYAQIAQRLMDDFIDLEIEHINRIINKISNDPEPIEIKRDELNLWKAIKKSCQEGRRTGTGLNAIGDTIAACGYKYGSKESISLIDNIFKILKLGCYRSSVDMAKEIGSFKVWDHELEKDNPFLLRIKDDDLKLWKDMKKYGRRNIGLLTMAPSGCVEENVKIKTDRGIISLKNLFEINNVNIEDLREKDNLWFDCDEEIYVYDVNGKEHRINKLYWKGYCSGYNFRFSSNENIKTSKEHKFLVLIDKNTAEWKKAKDLEINDKIIKLIED